MAKIFYGIPKFPKKIETSKLKHAWSPHVGQYTLRGMSFMDWSSALSAWEQLMQVEYPKVCQKHTMKR